MTALYRFQFGEIQFDTVGRLEKFDGVYLVRASATPDQGVAIARHLRANAGNVVSVQAIVGDEIVLACPSSRVKQRPNGARLEIACILG